MTCPQTADGATIASTILEKPHVVFHGELGELYEHKGNCSRVRLEHWAQIINERDEKGLSVHAYCESVGIHENTYFYWQRKLREAACSGVPEPTAESRTDALVPKGWTALFVDNRPAQQQGLAVEVGGCRIQVIP